VSNLKFVSALQMFQITKGCVSKSSQCCKDKLSDGEICVSRDAPGPLTAYSLACTTLILLNPTLRKYAARTMRKA